MGGVDEKGPQPFHGAQQGLVYSVMLEQLALLQRVPRAACKFTKVYDSERSHQVFTHHPQTSNGGEAECNYTEIAAVQRGQTFPRFTKEKLERSSRTFKGVCSSELLWDNFSSPDCPELLFPAPIPWKIPSVYAFFK